MVIYGIRTHRILHLFRCNGQAKQRQIAKGYLLYLHVIDDSRLYWVLCYIRLNSVFERLGENLVHR